MFNAGFYLLNLYRAGFTIALAIHSFDCSSDPTSVFEAEWAREPRP